MRPGLVSITFRKLQPRDIVELVKKAGLTGIEWGGDVHVPHGATAVAREVRAMTEGAGLEVAAYGSYYRVGHSESEGPPFADVLASARELGAPLVRVWPGKIESQKADPQYRRAVAADAHRIASMAEAEGIVVAYEYHANTLTDTTASALQALHEADHPNLRSLWQPPNGKDLSYCTDGLRQILAFLTNVHVFHWWPSNADRHPLADGADRWTQYLRMAGNGAPDRYALIEFVKGDTPEQFLEDARTLLGWLSEV